MKITYEYQVRNNKTNNIIDSGQCITAEDYIIINTDKWQANIAYKIQIRYIYQNQTSEWSTICYVNAIEAPEISVFISDVQNDEKLFNNSPTLRGTCVFAEGANDWQTQYCFTLFQGNKEIETSGWLTHNNEDQEFDIYNFHISFQVNKKYQIEYRIKTKTGYEGIDRTSLQYYEPGIDAQNFSFKLNNEFEEGYINIVIDKNMDSDSNNTKYTGSFVLRRTDDSSNFEYWEDYQIFNFINESNIHIEFKDYLVENGRIYQYSIQTITGQGMRGPGKTSEKITAEYEHMFLVGDNRQLKIKFDPKVSSFKRQLQETKTETIGSQYPFIRRNGYVNYFTFPIAGLISYHLDEQGLFQNNDNLYSSDERASGCSSGIPPTGKRAYQGHTNLTNDNIIAERAFRENVEAFLTNGNYKYFKSPTEGVKIISIMGVSLSPNHTLGRMISSFSSTANEVIECSLTNALESNIIYKNNLLLSQNVEGIIQNIEMSEFKEFAIENDDTDLISLLEQELNIEKIDYLTNLTITLVSQISESGYKINYNEGNEFIISPFVMSYNLDDVIVNEILVSSGVIQVKATIGCLIENIKQEQVNIDLTKYTSSFYQFSGTVEANTNIFDIIDKEKNILTSNLSYLDLQMENGKSFILNGEEMTMGITRQYILEDYIYSLVIPEACQIYANVVYNGYLNDTESE